MKVHSTPSHGEQLSAGKAVLWQFVSRYSSVAIQFVITMVLARLISPAQFGIIAIVTVCTTFFSTLADVGVGPAIIQYDLSDEENGSLFFFTILFGVALAAIFCLTSGGIAAFYHQPLLIPLCCVASLSIICSTADMVPNGLLLKRKEFKLIAVRTLVAAIVSGIVSIGLALLGFGSFALVINSVVQSFFIVVWNLFGSGLRVTSVHFMKPLKKVFRYSIFQAGFTTINYFARNLDNLLTGKFFGDSALGDYDKSYRLCIFPNQYLSGVIASVMQPYLVENRNDKKYIYDKYCDVIGPIAAIGAWLSCLLLVASPEVIRVLYGPQWKLAGPILQILSASMMFQMINAVAGAIFQTINHTDYMFYTSIINTIITVLGICLGIAGGNVLFLATGVSVAYILQTVVNTHFLVQKGLGFSGGRFALNYIPEFLLIISGIVAGFFFGRVVLWKSVPLSLAVKIVVVSCVVGIVYAITGRFKMLKRIRKYF